MTKPVDPTLDSENEVANEEQLEKSLVKMGALEDAILISANFSIIATDEKGVIQLFNIGAESMLGYTADDVLNKITPADISDPQEVIARAAALSGELETTIAPGFDALVFKASRGIEDIYELTYIRKDGSRFPALVSVTALRNEQQVIIGYLLIGTDNTVRKQVEAEREQLLKIQENTNKQLKQVNSVSRENEEKLAVTLHSIGDGVIATDARARVTLLNPLAEKLTGWSQADAYGRPVEEVFNIINKETRQPARIPVADTLRKGTIHGLDNHTVLVAVDGSECDIADSCAPIRDRDDMVIGAVLVFRDVTAEYTAEQALRDSNELIQTVLNTVGDGIITMLASGGVVATVNPAAERMFGYNASELMGKNFSMLIPELDQNQDNDTLEYYSASDEERAAGLGREVMGRCKNGRLFPMEMAVSEMWLGGQRYFTGILRDITARKHAEEELIKAGALQNAIFNSANFSSIATDAKGVIQIFNVGAERMLGYTADEVMDKRTPADISDPQEIIARAKTLSVELGTPIKPGFEALVFKASRGIEDIYELTYIRKDGSRFPAVVSVTALRDAHKTIIGYLLIGTDNTARKQASQYARSLLEASLDPLVTISAEGKVTDVNEGSITATGVAREKLIGTDFSDYFTEPDKARKGYQQVFANGFVTDYPLTIRHKDGHLTHVLYNASVYTDVHGNVLGVFAAARDITDRILAEEALLKAGALQNAIFNSANFSSIATDAKGVIQIFNVGAERMLGYTAAEVMDKSTPADISDPQEIIARAKTLSEELGTPIQPGFEALVFKASRGIEDIYELTYIRKDGSRFPAMVSVTALRDVQNDIIGYLLIGTDNTARKQVEAERAQLYVTLQDKNTELEGARLVAEKANHAKSEFLSSMSHELRTPLNAILGFAQLLESGAPPPTDSQLVRLHQIIKAGWYLLDLINEILDLSVIESGTLALSRESVLLVDVMHECQAMIEPEAQKRDIQLSFLPFDITWYANADRTRVKQVVINLLSNAIKYNREHGSIIVECSEPVPERIRISIKDSGKGLSPENLANLFQPFNRLGQEEGPEEGTGIGLVVTKQLVELMGAIGVKSKVGVGSEFWFELNRDVMPSLVDGHNLPTEQIVEAPDDTPMKSLLYVEDNSANLLLVEQIIADNPNMRMLSARDAHLGIAMARTYRPDVILMDINLPGISGFEALEILSNDPLTANIPVLAISANAMPRDIRMGKEAGFADYLTKPIRVSEFMAALTLALEPEESNSHVKIASEVL